MKTSNKILIGFLVVVFATPLLLATSLKSKMNKGEYAVKKYENEGDEHSLRSGTFTAFKVVKVTAPRTEYLNCHLKLSQDMKYRYRAHGNNDSIAVFSANDTLFISYLPKPGKETGENNDRLTVEVSLPALNHLVVDGAAVVIDSTSGSFSVTLKNNGVVEDGSKTPEEESAKTSPAKGVKKAERLEVAETLKAKNDKSETVRNANLPVLEFNMKDLLTYSLLYKI